MYTNVNASNDFSCTVDFGKDYDKSVGKCHCRNQSCDLEDGMCPDGGCQRGYEGSTCSTGMC
jgi:hypothetical protein